MQYLPDPYRPEEPLVVRCQAALTTLLNWQAIMRTASPWVQAVRRHPAPFWALESLLKEYPLSSAEGLALMRLAESLLRVPDMPTAIALTSDQLSHTGKDDTGEHPHSLGAHGFAAALALAKKFLPNDEQAQPSLWVKLGAPTVVAATLRAVQLLGQQFVLGLTMPAAMEQAAQQRTEHTALRFSYDMLGEGARTQLDAQRYFERYQHAIESVALQADPSRPIEQNDGVSVKLSALHPRYEATQHERVHAELVPRMWALCRQAAQAGVSLTLDAEESERLELSLAVFSSLAEQVAQQFPRWGGLGLAVQAYQTRSLDVIAHITALARQHSLRLMCRLVKGAYWDSEIKRAQELGLAHYPVYTRKAHTDLSYLACAQALLAAPDVIYPQFATHNAATIAAIVHMAGQSGAPFELQRLHGMGLGVYQQVLSKPGLACRVYAPVGTHKDLLAYLVRRLLENGANSSFVHQLADESVGIEQLLRLPEPQALTLPLPAQLFGADRVASAGLDLNLPSARAPLLAAWQALAQSGLPSTPVFDTKLAGSVYAASLNSYQDWSNLPVQQRTTVLRQAADALQLAQASFCALLVHEGFKTWADAVAEVREAVDFLRYYAAQAERVLEPINLPGPTGQSNELRWRARGVWVCISPWNFPLAIFLGQVAAALVTGNTVLAKPAEQTPAVATKAVQLLHEAGVPQDALQLLHGPGETVGAALVALPQIAGVAFTGSTAVAKSIASTLAAKDGPIVPFIAETGGVNAMLVDSSALPEQVADAVVQSAFYSAGQRCSALRLLCVHEAVADEVIAMVYGAAAELHLGPAADFASDVAPVIDAAACAHLGQHIERLKKEAKQLIGHTQQWKDAMKNIANLVAPHIFEVARIADVQQEIFGPVLHVLRWRDDPLQVIAEINALGYGLTLGLHTRIDTRAQLLAQHACVGNVYVNRNMIGAVVGVQPFGGRGLSGTGPKAGGPNYLQRFCTEQTVSINTAAAGGNVDLWTVAP